MNPILTIESLKRAAYDFCKVESRNNHVSLIGVTDGKAVGTYVEHKFEQYLQNRFTVVIGNSAKGIDLPENTINTDIKVTSLKQPQSSCPFKNARQKIYGLGYNLLVFVYEKIDTQDTCTLRFVYCTFINKERTADYTTSKRIIEMLNDGANREDILSFFQDKGIPGDEITLSEIADEVLRNTPMQGYLTISNALQWRLQYQRVITLNDKIPGITNYEWIF